MYINMYINMNYLYFLFAEDRFIQIGTLYLAILTTTSFQLTHIYSKQE